MNAALVLVDLQQDFLERPSLTPPAAEVTAAAANLLRGCRRRGLPVAHVQTVVRADGSDRMTHWKRANHWACVEGTPGACAPSALEPAPGEAVVRKPVFSGFGNPALGQMLKARRIDIVIVAGIYLHGCVRSTVLDAYERGYEVWVAEDATGSTEPEHAALSRAWLRTRAARFADVATILADLDTAARANRP